MENINKLTDDDLRTIIDEHDCHASPDDCCSCYDLYEELERRNNKKNLRHTFRIRWMPFLRGALLGLFTVLYLNRDLLPFSIEAQQVQPVTVVENKIASQSATLEPTIAYGREYMQICMEDTGDKTFCTCSLYIIQQEIGTVSGSLRGEYIYNQTNGLTKRICQKNL